jgi:hypothetical protein
MKGKEIMNLENTLFATAVLAVSLSTASPLARADASSQKNEAQPNIKSQRQTGETSHEHIELTDPKS